MRSLLYKVSPHRLRAIYARIESSPTGARLARGAFWSLAGSIILRALGLLSAVVVGRLLGKHEYGELGVIQNTIGMFGTLAGFGMGVTANKYLAEFKRTDAPRGGRILGLASATAWISSLVIAVILFILAPWLTKNTLAAPHLSSALRMGAVLIVLSGVNAAQSGGLSGFESFKAIARINAISGALAFPMMIVGAECWGVMGAVFGTVGSQATSCILSHLTLRREARKWNITLTYKNCFLELPLFWRFSLPAVLIGLLNSVVTWGAGALVVNQMGGYGDMGVFNAATRIKGIPDAVLGMLLAPLIPVLSESFGNSDPASYKKQLRIFLAICALTLVPIALIQTSSPQLTLIAFGPQYQGHPEVVTWLMAQAVLSSLGMCVGYVLIAADRMWLIWVISVAAAAAQILFVLWLVPTTGACGYAASQTLAYLIWLIPGVVLLYRSYGDAMKFARWGTFATLSCALFVACALFRIWADPWLALPAGLICAAGFVLMVVRSLGFGSALLGPPTAASIAVTAP